MIRAIKAFGLFWKDFLIGDCPELAVGSLIILGVAFALHVSIAASAVIVPLAIVLLLALSVRRAVPR